MSDPAAVVGLALISCTSAVFIVKAIAGAVVRIQDNSLRHRTGGLSAPAPDDSRLQRIEHALDSIAVEVERISENQRFTTKLLNERVAEPKELPAGKPPSRRRAAET